MFLYSRSGSFLFVREKGLSGPVKIPELQIRKLPAENIFYLFYSDALLRRCFNSVQIKVGVDVEVFKVNQMGPYSFYKLGQCFKLRLLIGNAGKDQVVDHGEDTALHSSPD